MPIIFARVDDRLIHGQVVQAWLPELNVDEVLIPCAKHRVSSLNKNLLRLSLPYEYELTVLDSHKCVQYARNSRKRIFALVSSLQELADLIQDGLEIKSINIGGMHFKEHAQKIDENVFLDEDDKRWLKVINGLGIRIETRAVPSAKSVCVTGVLQ